MSDITALRLQNQQISANTCATIVELVSWMGAMQAQDYTMMKWAVGLRLPGVTDTAVEEAVAKGEIIRTHLLRPTWHLVAAKDIRWILELTAPRIKPFIRNRHKKLGLDESFMNRGKAILEKELAGNNHLTREEIIARLEQEGFSGAEIRTGHLLMACELDGLICSGKPKGKKQTFALLDERVPTKQKVSKDEALQRLAQKYFASHGPASVQDFEWWSGLTLGNSRKALAMIKESVKTIQSGDRELCFLPSETASKRKKQSAFLVPAYDEYIISYCDRSDVIAKDDNPKAISSNGFFWPTVVIDGKVAGTWKKVTKKDSTKVEYNFFRPITEAENKLIAKAETQYLQFLK